MSDILIVGYGNTLRGDDAIGPYVVGRLEVSSLPPGTRCLCLPQLDISLVVQLSEVDLALFVDARSDADYALIRVDRIAAPQPCPAPAGMPHTTHTMGLPMLLGLAAHWYGKAPDCCFLQPKGFDFSIGDTLSDAAHHSAALAQQVILQISWAHVG